eukprot:evm.model.NODE_42202_length_15755_cov_35.941162.1
METGKRCSIFCDSERQVEPGVTAAPPSSRRRLAAAAPAAAGPPPTTTAPAPAEPPPAPLAPAPHIHHIQEAQAITTCNSLSSQLCPPHLPPLGKGPAKPSFSSGSAPKQQSD